MGGMHGYCRGKTKLACYKNFRRVVNRQKIEDSTELYMDAGTGTKQALRQDEEGPRDGGVGSVLSFWQVGGKHVFTLLLLRCQAAVRAVRSGREV